ncbi:GDYXXLXY domain-containing protein [Psychrobacter jeotgali]|uniref:GDYXXLXY domain-containing protein n=1 Tax=Psychrobacter jeotgali TaxID=179010 RepID=UPI001917FD2C|nr:GDYXXLXY domain-containing protein [Psychrobacter jeotgali]
MSAMNNKNYRPNVQKPSDKSLRWWQKRTVNISIALLGLLLVIAVMTVNVAKYETHLATGETVLLALAPVDPRGFIQGDYMALRYALEDEVFAALNKDPGSYPINSEGYIIIVLDDNSIGQFVALADDKPDTLAINQMALYYRIRNGSMRLATNAFFFQEGQAEAFEAAEYGRFRVNDKGEPLLTAMVDGNFIMIEAK